MATITPETMQRMNEIKLIRKILDHEIILFGRPPRDIYEQLDNNDIPYDTYQNLKFRHVTYDRIRYLEHEIDHGL